MYIDTTVGRVIFNRRCLPQDYPFINYKLVKSDISALVNDCCDRYNTAEVEPILDREALKSQARRIVQKRHGKLKGGRRRKGGVDDD